MISETILDRLEVERARARSAKSLIEQLEPELEQAVAGLETTRSMDQIQADAYWPKWDGPWWQMQTLLSVGAADMIPIQAVCATLERIESGSLKFFPLREVEIPDGTDPYRDILCHCALASLDLLVGGRGGSLDERFPWVRGWYLRYQLPDGGLNCDEAVYTRPKPHSSMVSTLPVMESLLSRHETWSPAEVQAVDAGARYLMTRSLCRSVSGGNRIIDQDWMVPAFPRFYEYDILRGLAFLARWAHLRGLPLPSHSLEEALACLHAFFSDESAAPRHIPGSEGTTLRQSASGEWGRGAFGSFRLLGRVMDATISRSFLRLEYIRTLEDLAKAHLD